VRGARHLRTGQPNQDAWAHDQTDGGTFLCVADGHGSNEFFRSDVGAKLAAAAAVGVLRASTEGNVPQRIVEAWRRAVDAHVAEMPYEGDPPRNALVPYGCTVLAIAATAQEIRLWQLGDGDILCVDREGKTRRPLPPDPRLIGNQTTSLCMEAAEKEFRSAVIPASEPVLIAVSTDGYANSFETDADFLQIGPDYLDRLRESGPNELAEQLTPILDGTSHDGSGDDITLSLLYREEAFVVDGRVARTLRKLRASWRRPLWIVTLLVALL